MINMSFKLPDMSELSIEQSNIINSPTNSNLVVVGGPGTGKSVLSVLRAKQIVENNHRAKVLLLSYNRPLMLLMRKYVKDHKIPRCQVSTYHQWLADFHQDEYGEPYPRIDNNNDQDNTYNPNWILININSLINKSRFSSFYDHIILDEAQDFPIKLINLLKLVTNNLTCFIDTNQTTGKDQISVHELLETLELKDHYTIIRNYRNTREINAVASLYKTEPTNIRSYSNGIKPILIEIYNFNDSNDYDYNLSNQKIYEIIIDNPDKSIGIITNKSGSQYRLRRYLEDKLIGLRKVEYYYENKNYNLDFNTKAVKLLTYGTVKGLEFDIVILPRFESITSVKDKTLDNNRIHIALSRAKSELYILYSKNHTSGNNVDTFSPINRNPHLFEWR